MGNKTNKSGKTSLRKTNAGKNKTETTNAETINPKAINAKKTKAGNSKAGKCQPRNSTSNSNPNSARKKAARAYANPIRSHLVGRPGRKRLGEASEAELLARASGFGLPVARPWGECEPYDVLVGFFRIFWRVQVKCTQRLGEGRYRVNNAGGDGVPYTSDEIDFIAAHIVPLNIWYIIPVEAAGSRKSLRFYPNGGGNGLLEKYREAWCLLACDPNSRGPKDIPLHCRCSQLPVRCAVCPRKSAKRHV